MHYRAYRFGLSLAILGSSALPMLAGCGSNGDLGSGLPGKDAAAGSTSGPSSTGGTTAAGGAVQGGNVVAGGAVQGGAVQGGNVVAGGAVQGGSSGTGGSSQVGDAGIGGVTLIASVTSEGWVVPIWQNHSSVSIFLYGCGSADVWKNDGGNWVNRGKVVACAWEGASPEVAPGATYSDAGPAYAVPAVWGSGTYRLQGSYAVGCTHPADGQHNAGCTAFYTATSNEVTVTVPPDAGAGGTGGKGGTTATGGATRTGGATGTGGTTAAGGSTQVGDAGLSGVTLMASADNAGGLAPFWVNQTQVSIFLYGCGSANFWKKTASGWENRGAGMSCTWEGVSPEVRPGATWPDVSSTWTIFVAQAWGAGTYRLQGKYGVGCTNPELGQSKAGCTAFYEAMSSEFDAFVPRDTGGGGGPDAGAGGVTGVALLGFTTADGHLVATWQNQSQTSIFLYGCGTADLWKWQTASSNWVKLSPGVVCDWEGVSPEVKPGATYSDTAFMFGPPALTLWSTGTETYRLTGTYGVGCTHPELGQSKAGCTAFYEATSYPISLSTSSGTGGSDGGGG